MQHLPLPKNPAIGNINIPLSSNERYDDDSFLTYPSRRGWTISLRGKWPYTATAPSGAEHTARELAGLVQSWLFFGLLTQYLDDAVDIASFETRSESGERLLTTATLESLVSDRTMKLRDQYCAGGSQDVKVWMVEIHDNIIETRNYILRFRDKEKDADSIMSVMCLSVAVLGEYLLQALKDLYISLGLESPISQKWRLLGGRFPADCGGLIIGLMQRRGWCPRDLAQCNRDEFNSIGWLWYFANLSPPRASVSHASWTAELCQSLQVEKSRYTLFHTCEGRDCSIVGPEQVLLERIILSGGLPLITIQTGESPDEVSVKIEPYSTGTYFVAVSHVWADVRGNPEGNVLHRCALLQIQNLLNKFPGGGAEANTPFWLDTLCVPRLPRSLRGEALKRLRDPFDMAGSVLVLDAYLQGHLAAEASATELLARVHSSGWIQRLWTFQEGRLADRVWFAFADRCVDLWAEVDRWRDIFTRLPPLACHSVDLLMIASYTATKVYPGQDFESGLLSLSALRIALKSRSTSVQTDEALCLSSILNLDMKTIVEAEPSVRMQQFWSMMPQIPAGLALSKSRQKLSAKGFRWAPASLMGQMDQKLWDGPAGLSTALDAHRTDLGLAVSLPAILFLASNDEEARGSYSKRNLMLTVDAKEEASFPLCDTSGRWFTCTLQEPWHQAPLPIDMTAEPAILMDRTLKYGVDARPRVTSDFQTQGTEQGVLVSYKREHMNGEVVPVNAHRHVRVQMMPKKQSEMMDLVKALTGTVFTKYGEELSSMVNDPTGMQTLLEKLIGGELRERSGSLGLVQSILSSVGDPDDEQSAIKDCVREFGRLCRLGPWTTIEFRETQRKWCID